MATVLRRLLSPKGMGNLHRSLQHSRFSDPSNSPFLSQFLIRNLHTPVSRNFCSATNYNAEYDALVNRIPATVVTGFFGSGKTTLLNHILTAQHGKRIAVIQNEFREVDGSLVASDSSANEDIVMVSNNGCLCCTGRGELVTMVSELVKNNRDKFDHIVIQTTGLAKPGPVHDTFGAFKKICQYIKLDGVVTLVDCEHAIQRLNEVKPIFMFNESLEQVAYADRIILNKIDLVSDADLVALTKKIQHINGIAQIKQAKFGNVDMDFVVGVGGYDLDRFDFETLSDDSVVSSVSIVSEGTVELRSLMIGLNG